MIWHLTHFKEVSLTQNLETIKLQDLTTLDLFYLVA